YALKEAIADTSVFIQRFTLLEDGRRCRTICPTSLAAIRSAAVRSTTPTSSQDARAWRAPAVDLQRRRFPAFRAVDRRSGPLTPIGDQLSPSGPKAGGGMRRWEAAS